MVSALVHGSSGPGSSPIDSVPWPGTLCCVLGQDTTLTVPLSTQEYKWVPVICWGNLTNCWGVTCDGLASRLGGVEILLTASCYGNWDKLWPDEPVGSRRLHYKSASVLSRMLFSDWLRYLFGERNYGHLLNFRSVCE